MNIVNKDSKNTFTRMCIGEAIIKLLKDTDFDKIRITSVAKCARCITHNFLQIL